MFRDSLSIDFETGSRADLKKTGAARYAEDPSTRVLCMAYCFPGGNIHVWREGEPFPKGIIDWVRDGKPVSGWNVLFEYWIWNLVLRRQCKGQPIPKLQIPQLNDTMAVAAYNGLPLSLDMCAKALPHLGILKDKHGHSLMLRMSRPRDPKINSWWHLDDPSKFNELCQYCMQDVRVEMTIGRALVPLPARERMIWEMDAHISCRGMLLDVQLANAIDALSIRETDRLDRKINFMTNSAVPNTRSVKALLDWAQQREPAITSLAKDRLDYWINTATDSRLRQVLQIRQEAAKSSVAKVTAMKNFASLIDNRMRGLYQYYGAFRTGRDAGRGPQLQNYPRGSVKDQDRLVKYIMSMGDRDGFEIFFGVPVLEALSSALRACITVPAGKLFCSYDFSQIEARVTPWLAGDDQLMSVFVQGKDIYVVAASRIFGVPESAVDAQMRQIGKVCVLALGFGGGVGAFQSMAVVYGVEVPDEEAEQIKTDWREANPAIVRLWYAMDDAALNAVRNPGKEFSAGRFIKFRMVGRNLHMRLPSGRDLIYREPEIGTNKFGRDCVKYWGVDQYTRQWTLIDSYGGKWCENATQAVARDVMKSAALRIDLLPDVDILGPIHDELLMELDDPAVEREIIREMNRPIPWAPGLPIAADGYVGTRFKK